MDLISWAFKVVNDCFLCAFPPVYIVSFLTRCSTITIGRLGGCILLELRLVVVLFMIDGGVGMLCAWGPMLELDFLRFVLGSGRGVCGTVAVYTV